jgi:hypothetical protein
MQIGASMKENNIHLITPISSKSIGYVKDKTCRWAGRQAGRHDITSCIQ